MNYDVYCANDTLDQKLLSLVSSTLTLLLLCSLFITFVEVASIVSFCVDSLIYVHSGGS